MTYGDHIWEAAERAAQIIMEHRRRVLEARPERPKCEYCDGTGVVDWTAFEVDPYGTEWQCEYCDGTGLKSVY